MDTIQKVLVKAGRKDLAQEYYLKVAEEYLKYKVSGIGYELYAKGLDRISVQCKTISSNAEALAKLVRENANDRKMKKTLKELQKFVNMLNSEMKGISSDITDLEGYKQ